MPRQHHPPTSTSNPNPTRPPRPDSPQPTSSTAAPSSRRHHHHHSSQSHHPRPHTRSHLGQPASALQFQTPPSQSQSQGNPQHAPIPQLHPSPGPYTYTYTPAGNGNGNVHGQGPREAHPATSMQAQAAIFSLFGRGVPDRETGEQLRRQQGHTVMDDEEEYDEEDVEEDEEVYDEEEEEGYEGEFAEEELDGMDTGEMVGEEEEVDEEAEEGIEDEEEEEEEEEMMPDREKSPSPLPPNLREISSLASWTVSTHKPGCGVSALRNPSNSQYWQSDGPQPHTLTLHFFKLVAVVKIRVYLDFDMDESYTPTKMAFMAGMGGNDLVEFATWEGETPCGWVDVPLTGVGGRSGGWVRRRTNNTRRRRMRKTKARRSGHRHRHEAKEEEEEEEEDDGLFSDSGAEHDVSAYSDDADETPDSDDPDDPYAGNVLKAMVLQMRVLENHQNGKDTHVRGFQVFARDDDRRRRMGAAPSASADGRVRRHSARKSLRGSVHEEMESKGVGVGGMDGEKKGLEEPDWMGEPVIR